jgi:hypothetical protein
LGRGGGKKGREIPASEVVISLDKHMLWVSLHERLRNICKASDAWLTIEVSRRVVGKVQTECNTEMSNDWFFNVCFSPYAVSL